MQVTSKLVLLLLILALVITDVKGEGTAAGQYEYALQLYSQENYFDAITEFKRLLFFDAKGEYGFRGNIFIGQSYKLGGFYDNAVEYFRRGEMAARSRDEIYIARIEIVKVNILRRTTGRAFALLNQLEKEGFAEGREGEINYWRGWGYIFNDEWKRGGEEFNKSGYGELARRVTLTEEKFYSPSVAKILSMVIPGGGQFYTKEYLSGVLSFAWNLLFGYLTINAFIEERIVDGFLTANFLWLRFYYGNIQNAEKFVQLRNNEIMNEELRFLKDNYRGEKLENLSSNFVH